MTRTADARPEPLRVPVADVTVRQSLTGGQAKRPDGLNPALIVVQRPVRYISDAPPPPRVSEPPPSVTPSAELAGSSIHESGERESAPMIEPSELGDAVLATIEARAGASSSELHEAHDPLELDEEELESDDGDDGDDVTLGVSIPPPAPPEALRRVPSSPVPPRPSPSDPVVDIEIEESLTPPGLRLQVPPPAPVVDEKTSRVAELRPTKPRPHAWWELFFNDDYLRTVRQPSPQQIARQCDFIVARLGLKPGATVLDVGCGLGLQVAELAARGYGSVGLDLSLAMLSRASEEAQGRGLRINFLHADMRELSFEGSFDAVTCLGTTLGYFDDETNRKVLERLLRALKPGGALLLDVVNRDHVIRSQPNLIWFEGEGCVCMEESEFNYFTSRLQVKRTVILENGRQVEHEYALRLYSLHELGQLMNASGFRVTEVSGREALPGVFFGQESPNLMIVAVRRNANDAPANSNASVDQ